MRVKEVFGKKPKCALIAVALTTLTNHTNRHVIQASEAADSQAFADFADEKHASGPSF